MRYNLANDLDVKEAREYLTKLLAKKSVVEIVEKHPSRSLSQNKYLYLLLSYCGLHAGMDRERI